MSVDELLEPKMNASRSSSSRDRGGSGGQGDGDQLPAAAAAARKTADDNITARDSPEAVPGINTDVNIGGVKVGDIDLESQNRYMRGRGGE